MHGFPSSALVCLLSLTYLKHLQASCGHVGVCGCASTIYSTELLLYCYFAAHGEANSFCSLPCWDLGTRRLGNNRIPWSLTNSKLHQLYAPHCSLFSFLKSETLRRNIHTRSRSRGSPCHQRRRPNPSNTSERSTMISESWGCDQYAIASSASNSVMIAAAWTELLVTSGQLLDANLHHANESQQEGQSRELFQSDLSFDH